MSHYNTFFRRSGFVDTVDRFDAALRGGSRQQAAAHLSDEFLDAVCLVGPSGRCRERLTAFREAGVRYPILAPQPVNESPDDAIRRALDAMAGA
jgi:hypothetical protein